MAFHRHRQESAIKARACGYSLNSPSPSTEALVLELIFENTSHTLIDALRSPRAEVYGQLTVAESATLHCDSLTRALSANISSLN